MKNTLSCFKSYLKPLFIFIIGGQIIFAAFASSYTTPHYEGKIFFTTGIVFDGSDLHKLNEGAHYFGQTMIGWSKFPNFKKGLIEAAGLPSSTGINMHVQERQNMIFTVSDDAVIGLESLKKVKAYLESQMADYNEKTNTQFVMSNVDYSTAEIKRSYGFGAALTFVLSLALTFAIFFVKEVMFPPKLKF